MEYTLGNRIQGEWNEALRLTIGYLKHSQSGVGSHLERSATWKWIWTVSTVNRCCPRLPLTKLGHPSSCQSPGLPWKCAHSPPSTDVYPTGPAVLFCEFFWHNDLGKQYSNQESSWGLNATLGEAQLNGKCLMSRAAGTVCWYCPQIPALAPKDRWGPPPHPRDQLFFSSVKSKLGNHRFLTQVYILQAETKIKT